MSRLPTACCQPPPGVWVGLAALVLGAFLLLVGPLAPYLLVPQLQVTAGEAEAIARRHLEESGLAVREWHRATTLLDRTSSNETLYLVRHMGTGPALGLLQQEAPLFLWQVRFFRSAVEETAFVWVDETRHVRGFRHVLPEAAPAPSLDEGLALALATAGFEAQVPGAVGWQRAGGSSEEQEGRRDFRFTWERPLPAPSARLRAAVEISGDALSGVRISVRAPEEFLRERAARGPLALVWGLARGVVPAGLVVLAVALFALRYRQDRLSLREATLGGLAFAGLGLAALVADLPGVLAAYPTTMSLGEYLLWRVAAALQASVLDFVRGALIVGLALSLWRELALTPRDAGQGVRFRIARALILMVLAALLLPLLQVAPEALREALGSPHLATLASWTGAAGEGVPLAAAAVGAARQAIELVGLGVVGCALLRSRRRLWPLGLMAIALLLAPEVRDGFDLVQSLGGAATLAAGAAAGARWLGAHAGGYVAVLFGALLLDDALVLLAQPHILYQFQGAAAAILALAIGAVWPLLGPRASRPPGGVPAT